MLQRRPKRRAVSPRKKPGQARSQATVAAILLAAARIFQKHGYAAGTTNRIAERAGVSIGSLYEYFPSKDAILLALARQHLAEGVAVVQALLADAHPEEPVPALLTRVVTAMIRLHEQDPRLHQVLFEETPLPGLLRRELIEGEATLIAVVGGLLAQRRDLRTKDPALTAYLLVHLIESMTHRFVLHPPEGVSVERFVEEAVLVLARYLAP